VVVYVAQLVAEVSQRLSLPLGTEDLGARPWSPLIDHIGIGVPDRRREVLGAACLEDPGFVGKHDGLHAVSEVELLQEVRHVRFDCGFGDEELLADLLV